MVRKGVRDQEIRARLERGMKVSETERMRKKERVNNENEDKQLKLDKNRCQSKIFSVSN